MLTHPDTYSAYFDCKIRKLIVVLRVKTGNDDVVGDDNEEGPKKIEIVDTKKLENELLFDVV